MADLSRGTLVVAEVPQHRGPKNPISRKQVEKVISRSVAVFGIVFGAQTIPWLLGQLDEAYPVWLFIVVPALFGTLVVVLVLSFVRVGVRQAHGAFAVIYALSLFSWPFTVLPGADVFAGIHWLNYLLTVAAAMAAIAFTTRVATVYLLASSAYYMIVRGGPVGGDAGWQLAVLEGFYAIILGAAIMIIVTMLRQAATAVDTAQATALESYEHAVRQHATEVERVQVDSIVHDSVLTTFTSAARAFTPQSQSLAASMAHNAMGHLRDAATVSPDDGTRVRLTSLATRIADAASDMPVSFAIRLRRPGNRSMSIQTAEAVYSAAVQAMINSVQHAGEEPVSRWLSIGGFAPGGIEVIVGDHGNGFELTGTPSERLGVRVSIIERVASSGGISLVRSAPGEGTVVTIRWPHERGAEPLAPVPVDMERAQ